MSDHERGAYTPPTDAPLSFDPRQPVRGARPPPFTLIISILVLLGLAAAIFLFYRSGVRQAGQPPQAVGAPVTSMKAPPPAAAAQTFARTPHSAACAGGGAACAQKASRNKRRTPPGPGAAAIRSTRATCAACTTRHRTY